MRAALDLARLGRGLVEPNPMVGAVVVKDGQIVAKGWHRRFGGPHAEAEAIAAATPAQLQGATVYVTLEPCCHLNKKTPPCAQALIAAKVARVVAAIEDPDANVSGRGLSMLRSAGVSVTTGVCQREARDLLAPYIKLRTQGRPWVTLKWAQTSDGYLALPAGAPRWISNEASRRHTHGVRALTDVICVGVNTVIADDPLLNNRSGAGRQPARLILDGRLRTPLECKLANSTDVSPVIIATSAAMAQSPAASELAGRGVQIAPMPVIGSSIDLGALLDFLGERQWTHLLVEGGQAVLKSFLRAGLADELLAYISPVAAGAGAGNLPHFAWADAMAESGMTLREQLAIDGDTVLLARRE